MEPLDTVVRVTPSPRLAQDWATVMAAAGIRHRFGTAAGGWALMVAAHDGARANDALDAYDEEERPETSVATAPLGRAAIGLGVAVAVLLLAFFAVTGPRELGSAWFARGSASAGRILRGEAWRTVTALTLHSDLAHVLGNALGCAVLIPPVIQALGAGTGLWVLLLAGAIANWLTALVHGAHHDSVGASTLVFAAIGALAAQALVNRWRGRATGRRAWVVIVASFVLLLILGTAEGADVLAHAFGLLIGFVLGLAASLVRRRPSAPSLEWTLAAAAMGAVAVCWWVA